PAQTGEMVRRGRGADAVRLTLEEHQPSVLLQGRDLLRHRGRGVAEFSCGDGEGPGAVNGLKGHQMMWLVHVSSRGRPTQGKTSWPSEEKTVVLLGLGFDGPSPHRGRRPGREEGS